MIWTLLPFGLVAVFVAAILLSANTLAARPVYSSGEKPPGEEAGAGCLVGGKRSAQADKPEAL